mgnify:CR=1 FL=1
MNEILNFLDLEERGDFNVIGNNLSWKAKTKFYNPETMKKLLHGRLLVKWITTTELSKMKKIFYV